MSRPNFYDTLKGLFYAPSGHGKTHLIGTAAQDTNFWPMLILDYEGGAKTIRSKIREVGIEDLGHPVEKRADVVHTTSWDDVRAVCDFLEEDDVYRTVVVDSITEINYLCIVSCLGFAKAQKSSHDPDVLEQRDYLRVATLMRRFIRFLRDLNVHFIMTALAKVDEDPVTKKKKVFPNLTGKLGSEICDLVDLVGYLALDEDKEGNVERVMVFKPNPRFDAKARVEGRDIENMYGPTIPKIYAEVMQ